ncbi:MAG TPA: FG-GAP-like repeat-containing protein [Ignavibacteria bacterium]|nr:FG-GAP-like repeat-containing protein [Ignavibacteria bacterium]HRF64561.1 FG-GAP-like repeat-containing protein [Ignavibacteria bacterium]HRJ04380.1 FG-GAP-like repeat-containing protein [Ignavibacteria bacterium]HRJ86166.1 FG-GAP-like repeat-containing protein [Ignavibacteria bacterium]
MKKILLLTALIFLIGEAYAQVTFTKVTAGAIVNDASYTEGVYWFDYNNDGLLDMFAANITNQNNILFRNDGSGNFTKITAGTLVNDGGFSYGASIGDFNNDGYPDIFIVNGGSSASQFNTFYTNNGDGTFTKITTGAFVNEIGNSWGCSSVDYDKDGKLDLYTANFNRNNFLYKGGGDGTFTKITAGAIVNDGGNSITCAWGDYDNDGWQDIFVANASFSAGENNFLYRNNGDGSFTKVTTGVIVNDGGNSTGASWGDYDNDGDLDLFVTNYFTENNSLYRNEGGGTFTKITAGEIVNDGGASVGSAWGDYDNDGDLDLFVSNDNDQNEFLYNNNGNGTFTKITSGDIVNSGGRSNGSAWGDYDLDGDIDLYVANGNQPVQQNNFLFRNNGSPSNWINIYCKGVISNRSAIGTRVITSALINGVRVKQTREISGQSGYNAQNSLNVELGLGNAQVIDTIIIKWPSGLTDIYYSVAVNMFVTAVENQGIIGINNEGGEVPGEYDLSQNYPNPFNPSTNIKFLLPNAEMVKLKIYDILGNEVSNIVDEMKQAGAYVVTFDASKLSSGIYFYTLEAGNYRQTKKMLMIK